MGLDTIIKKIWQKLPSVEVLKALYMERKGWLNLKNVPNIPEQKYTVIKKKTSMPESEN